MAGAKLPRSAILLLFFLVVGRVSVVPAQSSPFVSTLLSTIDELQQLLSLVYTFSGVLDGGDIRSASAVQDCLDLLGLSIDELNWTISAAQNHPSPAGGSRRHDSQSWLSGALGNQGTCSEGLDGTNMVLKTLVINGMGTVTNLVAHVLSQVPHGGGAVTGGGSRKLLGVDIQNGFPSWMRPAERRLMQTPAGGMKPDAVVSPDGTGDFKTVSAAVDAVPAQSTRRIVIYVKRGVYAETVDVKKKKWNIMLVGDGMGQTIITGNRNVIDGWTTYRSATFAVSGMGFIARDITFENTAGPEKHQAVALRSDSDLSVYYRCEIKGYQDTLYAHSLRQFYRECRISGTVDFIFGDASAVFQNCQILCRLPLPNQKNTITAQGRKDPNEITGFSIQYCNITADVDLASSNQTSTYLGRPWKEYSRTVVLQSHIDSVINPRGWLEWSGDFALATLYYAEYMNDGPGSGLGGRVNWPGFHALNDSGVASSFTVAQFIDGNSWLPATGVTYIAGLTT